MSMKTASHLKLGVKLTLQIPCTSNTPRILDI